MTDFAPTGLTLQEVAHRHDPNGEMATIVDALREANGILEDAVWSEGNDRFANKATRWAKEPSGAFRLLGAGVTGERGETVEVKDVIGMLDAISKNDVEYIHSFSNPTQARNDEAMAFVRGMSKTMAYSMFYANTIVSPEAFTGLAPRMDTLVTGGNVVGEGGSGGDTTSIFVVNWGKDTVTMLYPRGSKAGLEHINMGTQLVTGISSSGDMRAYVDYFTWKAGLAVKDPKSIGRLANIEVTGVTNIFDEDNLITLLNRMNTGPGTRIYCTQSILTQMEIRLKDKTNVHFTKADGIAPGFDMIFKRFPVRKVDQISETETAVA